MIPIYVGTGQMTVPLSPQVRQGGCRSYAGETGVIE
jgi:hypothetical protein